MELYYGDCIEVMNKLLLTGKKFEAIICDPPYNIKYSEWDSNFDIQRCLVLCKQLIKENGNIILFQGYSNVCDTKQIMDRLFVFQNWIVWDRIKGRGAKKQLVSTREDILWYCNGDSPTFNKIYSNIPKKTKGMGEKNGQSNRALTNVWYDISPIVPWSKERVDHPTQKPLELMKRIVTIWTNENDCVLDFTMGSGTTGVAALELKRDFYGIENDKDYFEIASNRLNFCNN